MQTEAVVPKNNLPLQLSSFIGREKEQEEVIRLVKKNRLLTLVGAGGIGKSRLSIQVASALLNDFPNGLWLVELAPLSDPALVPQAIVTTLGLIDQAGRSPQMILADFLQTKRALLVLDNCEHFIQACAELAEALLRTCPDLHILATSREALGIAGETLYLVPALTTPDPVRVSLNFLPNYEAVQLFVERAQSALAGFMLTPENASTIAQICHQLDGIPLALELAAARIKMMSVEQIASHLNDRFHLLTGGARTALPRHQTLQAMIDWSHDLLSEPERVLLRRLSMFTGGWTLESAESVCLDEGIEKYEILDLLTQLLNKSLILAEHKQGQETRYRMLETICQYARGKLWAVHEGELMRQRHLAYFVDLAERAEPNLRAFDMIMWLDQLEAEHDNIRAALARALESNIEAELRLASALLWFWHIRSHKNEGIDWLEQGLSIEAAERGDQSLTPNRAMIRGKALNASGALMSMFFDFGKAQARLEESLVLFRELRYAGKQGMAYALWGLADMRSEGNRARNLLEQSLTLFRELMDKFGVAQCLDLLGEMALEEGDRTRARVNWEESLALRKDLGDKEGIAYVFCNLGHFARSQHDDQVASTLYEKSLALYREVGNRWMMGQVLTDLGWMFYGQGDYSQAAKRYEEALRLHRDVGEKYAITNALNDLARVGLSQGDYGQAAKMLEEGLALTREGDHKNRGVGSLIGLGEVAWSQGDYEQATQKFEEALVLSQQAEDKGGTVLALYGLGRVAQSQGNYSSARALHTEGIMLYRERVVPSWEKKGAAYHLEALATLAADQNQIKRSALLFGAADALYPPLRFEMSAKERAEHDQAVDAARAALDEEAFTGAYEEGKKMTLDEAVAYALEED
jgi:predicted ATPase